MSITSQRYALYRDDTLIASDLPFLPVILKFAREDARREYSQERPACYVITGLSGFKRVGSHIRGRIHWEDQSRVSSCFRSHSDNWPPATAQAVQHPSHGSFVSPSEPLPPSALAPKVLEALDQPGIAEPDPTQKTIGFTKNADEVKFPEN